MTETNARNFAIARVKRFYEEWISFQRSTTIYQLHSPDSPRYAKLTVDDLKEICETAILKSTYSNFNTGQTSYHGHFNLPPHDPDVPHELGCNSSKIPACPFVKPPEGYKLIPGGARCRCLNLWSDGKGNFYCCNQKGKKIWGQHNG